MTDVPTALQPLHALFDGAHVGIWGFRAEGVAALRFLRGFDVAGITIVDDTERGPRWAEADQHADAPIVGRFAGDGAAAELARCDVVIRSSGVNVYAGAAEQLRQAGTRIVGGMQLFTTAVPPSADHRRHRHEGQEHDVDRDPPDPDDRRRAGRADRQRRPPGARPPRRGVRPARPDVRRGGVELPGRGHHDEPGDRGAHVAVPRPPRLARLVRALHRRQDEPVRPSEPDRRPARRRVPARPPLPRPRRRDGAPLRCGRRRDRRR